MQSDHKRLGNKALLVGGAILLSSLLVTVAYLSWEPIFILQSST